MVPSNAEILILTGSKPLVINNNILTEYLDEKSYGEILLRSKALITHFGITLFEGYLTRCKLITINPSEYHNELTDLVQGSMDVTDCGLYDSIDAALFKIP